MKSRRETSDADFRRDGWLEAEDPRFMWEQGPGSPDEATERPSSATETETGPVTLAETSAVLR